MPRAPKVKLPRTVTINGDRWRIVRWYEDAEPHKNWGECYFDDHVIWIHPDLEGDQLVCYLLHELNHAANIHTPEHSVTEHGKVAARYLKRAGLITK